MFSSIDKKFHGKTTEIFDIGARNYIHFVAQDNFGSRDILFTNSYQRSLLYFTLNEISIYEKITET